MTVDQNLDSQPSQTVESNPIGELSFSDYQKVRRGDMKLDEAQKPAPESKAPVQKAAVGSDPMETEDSEESEEELGEESGKSNDSDSDKPKKKNGIEKRFNKLTARVADRDAKLADRERELDYWKSQAMKNGATDQPGKDNPVERKADVQGKPNPETFETHSEYVEALTDWKVDQKDKEKQLQAEKQKLQSDQEQVFKSHSERVQSFAKTHDDFQELLEAVDDVPISMTVQQIIVSSDNGPELMYELAKNRAEYARICALPPLAAARELGKIESRMSSETSDEPKEIKKLTNAPKPIEPVNGNKGAVRRSIDDPNLPFADYVELRRKQMKRR